MDELEKEILKSAESQPKIETASTKTKSEKANSNDDSKKKDGKWGYDMYPERRGNFTPGWGKTLATIEGREKTDRIKCERNIYNCVMKSPLVKIMMGALNASGW